MEDISPTHAILIAQQIASAAHYLHQFGCIHSNISSHCILLSNHRNGGQWNAKLSSFELATSTNVGTTIKDVAAFFDQPYQSGDEQSNRSNLSSSTGNGGYSFVKNRKKTLKQMYQQRSRQSRPYTVDEATRQDRSYLSVLSAHLPYHLNYRRHLSQYNYQPLELLGASVELPNIPFVFPTVAADVYGCTLLLWEMLNRCVPYAVHDAAELQQLLEKRQAYLPIFEPERCRRFVDLFTLGLEIDVRKRQLQMDQFLERLNMIRVELRDESTVYANASAATPPTTTARQSTGASPSLPRDKPLPPIPLTAAQIQQLQSQSPVTLTKDGKNATMYKSLLEFNKFLLLGSSNGERTSTLKKKKKSKREAAVDVVTPKELFAPAKQATEIDNNDIIGPVIVRESKLPTKCQINHEKTKFLDRLLLPDKSIRLEPKSTSAQPLLDTFKTVGNFLDDTPPTPPSNPNRSKMRHKDLIKSAPPPPTSAASSSSYRFSIGDFTLPQTPIARSNKIRRNAWLSDQQISVDDDVETKNKTDHSANSTNCNKRVNVSIKIVHNKVSPVASSKEPKAQKTTPVRPEEIPDLLTNDAAPPIYFDQCPLTPRRLNTLLADDPQIGNLTDEYNKCLTTSQPANVTVDFQNIVNDLNGVDKDPAAVSQQQRNGDFEKHWIREKSICDKSALPSDEKDDNDKNNESDVLWTPVKATILQFENWLANSKSPVTGTVSPSPLVTNTAKCSAIRNATGASTPMLLNDQKANETTPVRSQQQEPMQAIIKPSSEPKNAVVKSIPEPTKLPSTVNGAGRKLMTTCVTLNLRQRRRRSSDLGLSSGEAVNRRSMAMTTNGGDSRHSICAPDIRGLTVERANTVINGIMMSSLYRPKYICCNCTKVMSRDEIKACKCFY